MRFDELLEWLGITFPDLLVYLATGALVAMFFISNRAADIALAAVGIVLGIAACPLGMKRNPKFSHFTNVAKLVSYPLFVLLAVAAITVHYIWFAQ